jgi:hypothetical protein
MFDKLKENLEHNLDHLSIVVHRQVDQVIYQLLPKNTKIFLKRDILVL